ncbi:hypothetical protein [Streptomyces sp. Da 82-17]|uniref:hypothetical protein n=1 Tax=Streptomyces sp. Da 82-17 TaxID=3377116 RepID=UPI0038D47877
MSSAPEPTEPTSPDSDPTGVEPPVAGTEPEPSSTPEPTPDPIPPPSEPIVYVPNTWYSATWTCRTSGCVNENQELFAPMLYSNNGITLGIFCGRCNTKGLILTVTLLDPQPEPE